MEVKYGPYPWYFIWSFVLGLGLAFIYDLLRLSRRVIKTNDLVINIPDIVFLILSGLGAACTAYAVNNGQMRAYALLGTVLGFTAYRMIFKMRIVSLFEGLLNAAGRAVLFVCRILLMPVRFAVRVIGKPVFVTLGSLTRKIPLKFTKEKGENR